MTFRTLAATLAVAVLLPLSGCDETGLALDETSVIGDAQVARQNGDYATAVRLLEDALDRNPSSAPIRTELAATLLEREDLNLLDLDRISQFVVNGPATVAGQTASRGGSTCAFANDPTATPFDPTDVGGFPEIEASQTAVDSVLALIAPVLPAALTTFSPCTTVGADGQLVYDQASAAAQLRASGLTDAQISQLLATNALARFLDAYLFVTTEVPQQAAWYRLANGGIGICVDDQDALIDQTEEAVSTLGTALLSLDTRARSFGGTTELVELAIDAFDDIKDALGDYCAAQV
ncbi:MAG TPA: tetratricopeptide repeat protein [Rubricoccaceae bacterium]|jgi:hypothetical protein